MDNIMTARQGKSEMRGAERKIDCMMPMMPFQMSKQQTKK